MSPLGIDIMLWHYTRPRPYEGESHGSPAYNDTLGELLTAGLLLWQDGQAVITDGGKMYCEALCAVPFPVQQWAMPTSAQLRGVSGGLARAAKLTPARPSEIATIAAAARWAK